MAGKKVLFGLLIGIFLSLSIDAQTIPRKAYLRSGLLFERSHGEPILVNPTQLTFYRNLNLTLLLQTNELLQHYTKSYIEFCDFIRGTNVAQKATDTPNEYFFLNTNHTMDSASTACLKNQGKLAEIKTHTDITDIQNLVATKHFTTFPAGIYYDKYNQLFKYNSNEDIVSFNPQTFQTIAYDKSPAKDEKVSIQSPNMHKYASNHKIMYIFNKNKDPILKFFGSNTYEKEYPVLCQKLSNHENKAVEATILMKITAHTCLRDYQSLNATSVLIEKELNDFTKPPKNRIARDTNNTKAVECFTDICNNLSIILQLIEQHPHIYPDTNHTNLQAKLTVIYHTLQKHNLTSLTDYEQFINLIFIPEAAFHFFSSDPQAELIYLYSKEIASPLNQANLFDNFKTIKRNSELVNQLIALVNSKNPIEFFHSQITHDLKHIRYKRNPALAIGGGLMLANSISSHFSGDSPFSWFGNVLSSTLGLATRSDVKHVLQHLEKHAQAISDITINQEQLYDSYLQVRQNVKDLQDTTSQLEYGTANMAIELDNKLAIKHLQFVMQLTLLKIASAFTSASNHKASPYIFSQQALDSIASNVQQKKIFLSTNMNDVIVNVVQNDTQILFSFTIPVLDDRAMFNFYEAKNIPIFQHNTSYKADVDLRFFAITANTNEYSMISESEYYICLTNKQCQISDVIHPINSEAHCTVQTFQENKQKCNLIPTAQPEKPYFAFYGNRTFFSVPTPLTIRITCQESTFSYVTDTQTQTVSGTGFIEIKPSCSIVLPDNRKYFSNPILEAEYLENPNFMNILKESQPTILNFTFQVPKPTDATTQAPITLKPIDLTFMQQIYHEITEPAKALSTAAIFFLIIFCIIAIILTLCVFSQCFRTWFSTCTLMKNPKEWWTNYKSYDLSTFEKLRPSTYFKVLQRFRSKPISNRPLNERTQLEDNISHTDYYPSQQEYNIERSDTPQTQPITHTHPIYPQFHYAKSQTPMPNLTHIFPYRPGNQQN